jgi:type II secretory pathway component PulM
MICWYEATNYTEIRHVWNSRLNQCITSSTSQALLTAKRMQSMHYEQHLTGTTHSQTNAINALRAAPHRHYTAKRMQSMHYEQHLTGTTHSQTNAINALRAAPHWHYSQPNECNQCIMSSTSPALLTAKRMQSPHSENISWNCSTLLSVNIWYDFFFIQLHHMSLMDFVVFLLVVAEL